MMKRLFLWLGLAGSSQGFAQQSPAQPALPLQRLLQQVEAGYPSIKARQEMAKAGSYYVAAAEKNFLPELTAGQQFTYSTNNGLVGSFYNNEGTTISTSGGVRPENIYEGVFGSFTTLSVNWRIFTFGRLQQEVNYARSQEQLAKDDISKEIFRQQITAADAYLRLALLQRLQWVQQQNLSRAATFQQYVLSRAKAGLLPGADSSFANAEVAKARIALLQSNQATRQQRIFLQRLTGIAADSIIADTTFFSRRLPATTAADSLAIAQHPFLQYATQQVKVANEKQLAVKKSILPSVNLLGMGWARGSGIDRETNAYSSKLSDGIPWQTYNYMGALAIKWNILSLAKNKQEVHAAQAVAAAANARRTEQQLALNAQLDDARLQYQLAWEQTKLAPVQYQSASDAWQQSNARYQAGLATLTELVQTLYALNRADVDKTIATNNVWRGLLLEAAATGNINLFTNQVQP
ncbi:TolC family protein [Flavihumibacter petaseus]|uniref:Putative RND-type efflux pump outer membrane protein n=1 Tax=Flavihumibacter petaseus NBRC 106054 TaxID=1220578 RepID=A0A0E9N4D1_9BACT|nr:TolC family protein [Flavihumibacter petaseus]GAO44684.1 putative RND-type efflux pump outer membrane protein [Flavihumibacter petaseus NBRC 106054]